MRFHCLGLPHTVTSHEYVACAYTQKVLKFAKMMKARGHHIIHYGHEDSNLICDEHVTVITNKDLEIAYGNYDWRKNFFKFSTEDHAYKTFVANAIYEVGKRKQKNDFILPFWGSGVRPVCDAHPDIICVEPGIGYAGGHWAKWKIWESYAIFHAYMGLDSVGICKEPWYDAVIPNYFDTDDFEYCEEKEDYFLFLGRVYNGKGVNIAIQATKKIGAKLVIAGQKSLKEMGYKETPSHVTEIGYADKETRKRLMAKAKGAFVASLYTEPFGGVQIEMLLSGTPTITTDWGAFTENNIHGLTGYRCRTFDHFCWAARNIHKIKPRDCRNWAMNFSFEKIGRMYEEYFQNVLNVYTGKGWYEEFPTRPSLEYLEKPLEPKLPSMGDIFFKHKTDKLSAHPNGHCYSIKYEELFEPLRHKKIRLFEMGIGSVGDFESSMKYYQSTGYKPGASLRAWREYFTHPETEIFGGDIDGTICDDKTTFQIDQTNPEKLKNLFDKIGKFDIIIDDGLHTREAAQTMKSVCMNYLKRDGYYVVEDIKLDDNAWSHPKNCGKIQDNYLNIYRQPAKRFAVLKYSGGFNVGDDIQTLAAMHLLGTDDVDFIDREKLHLYDGPPVTLIMNGWFIGDLKNFPPAPQITPKIIGFHSHCEELVRDNVEYFKKWEPIGCRDEWTVGLFKKYGVKCWLSYCLTMGFDKYTGPRTENTYEIDVNRVDTSDHTTAVVKEDWDNTERRLSVARRILDRYRKAKHVKTGRLHCFLPCLAMGTPVDLVHYNKNGILRFRGYLGDLDCDKIRNDLKDLFKRWTINP